MRASRLLTVLMLLQSRGRMSAAALAREVEVSVRTVHRDIEELSASGVPVVAERGASGGYELLEGWRTRLTGLTPAEAQAIFMAGAAGPAEQLGLGGAMASAQLKLLAALPAQWQDDARRVGGRFHLDPTGWYRDAERPDHLAEVAQAVWNDRRLRIRYESWKGVVDRRVDPLGLVMKAGEWYVVALCEAAARTYKLSNIRSLEPGGRFERPRKFDLARHWAESIERFEAGLYRATATLRASERGLKMLRHSSAAVAAAVDRVKPGAKRGKWTRVTIPIESVEHAASELLKVGAECEVLEPAALRARIAQSARALAAVYRGKR